MGTQAKVHIYCRYRCFGNVSREVATLVDGEKSSGVYAVSWEASRLSSGVFIYRLKIGDFTDVKKMIHMK
ncbi:MAG: hypothetical protein NTX44_05305 [Ignavibacteriales bacterium]|nr:hypothetical protein [Ignavibacteriales bacterium]